MGYSAFGPFAGDSQPLLWEWNGEDTSQFGTPILYSSGNPGAWAATLNTGVAAISPHPGGTSLVFNGSGSAGVSGTHWYIAPILQELPQSFEVEINSSFIDVSTVNTGFAFAFFGDFSGPGFCYLWQPIARGTRIDNGTAVNGAPANVTTSTGASGQMRFRLEGRNEADYPRGQALYQDLIGSTADGAINRNAFNATDGDFNMGTLPPASWAGTNANQFGIAIMTTGVIPGPQWALLSMRIRGI